MAMLFLIRKRINIGAILIIATHTVSANMLSDGSNESSRLMASQSGNFNYLSAPMQSDAEAAKPLVDKLQASYRKSSTDFGEVYARWAGSDQPATGLIDESMLSTSQLKYIFSQAVLLAASRSPEIKQSYGEWQAAGFDVDQVKGQRWPQIQVGASTKSVEFGGRSEYQRSSGINVSASTIIFDWGRIRKQIRSRELIESANWLKFRAMLESNAYEVSMTLTELAKERYIVKVTEEYVTRLSELVNLLQEIVKVDVGRTSELTQVRARFLEARTSLEGAQSRQKSLELEMRKLVGNISFAVPSSLRWDFPLPDFETTLKKVRKSPQVLQAEYEADAQRVDADAIHSAQLPQLNWVVGKSTVTQGYNGKEDPWQTSLNVTWNVFQGGSARAEERAAIARAGASREKKEQLLLDTEFEVRNAWQDAHIYRRRAEDYQPLVVESLRVRREFFEQWYHLGKRTILDVLIAERDYYNNEIGQISAKFDSYSSVIKVYSGSAQLLEWLDSSRYMNVN
ncbi:TolC family protein [Salmonella enterica]|nr:TolC family protein [Salmonella enterica]ECW8875840.1 TolC family protein [Salmonella enterica]EIL1178319.1 TolC family protein [Salmonella enterica]EIO9955912.1 TolC family protein [Salmonella enterica]EIV5116116.1 TolC family protein [Salmonella enterica]